MPQLKIEISWYEEEVAIGKIIKDQKNQIDTYCTDNDVDFNYFWYREREVMEKIVGKSYWDEVDDMLHERGLAFDSEEDIKRAFEDAKIFLDGKEIVFDVEKIKYRFDDPQPLPKPDNADEIAVRSGHACDRASYAYELEIEDGFNESKLVLSLCDLTNLEASRFLISGVEYDGDAMEHDYIDGSGGTYFDIMFIEQN